MKDLINDIGKKLPYEESEEYLDGLIGRATEGAIKRQAAMRAKSRWGKMMTSAAAVALIVVGIGTAVWKVQQQQAVTTMASESPIDEFLNTLTDEEVAQLPYYEIEEIPEY